jgi:hypothetical protein
MVRLREATTNVRAAAPEVPAPPHQPAMHAANGNGVKVLTANV